MKHKWATLVNMQPEVYHQNSQSFYPSEPFTLDHIIMRHPVVFKMMKTNFKGISILVEVDNFKSLVPTQKCLGSVALIQFSFNPDPDFEQNSLPKRKKKFLSVN